MIRFAAPIYPGGRHCLMCGKITVGAVFPPVGHPPNRWTWRLWIGGSGGMSRPLDGYARDEACAKIAALKAFGDFLKEAQLAPVEASDA